MGALIPAGVQAQALSLDSCRAMALRNNKQLNASKLKKDVAPYYHWKDFKEYCLRKLAGYKK